jgi:hypothetical protein
MAAIDFKTFNLVAPSVLAQRLPVMIRGRHGVGKSEVVYQTARDLGLPVVERRASQMTEGDLIGMPDSEPNITAKGNKSTQWNAPDWFLRACEEPVVLFLDEVDRATPEVRQGIMELTDSRKIYGRYLHEGTVIVAAVNGGEHCASQYQVAELDPAELDRWWVQDIEPTVEDWLTWAKDNVDQFVWDFVNNNRGHLEHVGEYEPNKVYPSRRSWKRLSDTLQTAGLLADPRVSVEPMFVLASGFVGFEGAVALRDFAQNYDRQVTVEDILTHGKVEKTKDFTVVEHVALVDKMDAAEVFHAALTTEQVQNLANYFVTMPSEPAMKLWQVLGSASCSDENVMALHGATSSSDVSVADHLTIMLTGGLS